MKRAATILLAFMLLFPMYFMVQGSFSPIKMMLSIPPKIIPLQPSLENYKLFGEIALLWKWVGNSAILVGIYIVTGVLVNGLAGYAFAFGKFRGKQALFWAAMATMLVSRPSLLIPQYIVVRQLNLSGMMAVLAMTGFSAGYVYLFRNYFEGVPKSFIESAKMDGAGDWRVFWNIIMPLSKSIIAAVVVMRAIEGMTDYIWQVLNLTRDNEFTMLVGFTNAISRIFKWGLKGRDIGFELAAGVVLMLPLLGIFAFTSRYFIKGVTLGGEK